MSKSGGGHNDKLDLFKCISIYAVVVAHVPLPGRFGLALCALAKFSVVLFFLTAGYFSYEKSPAALARSAVKTGRLLLLTSVGLLIFGCVLAVRQGTTVSAYLLGRMDPFFLKEIVLYQLLPLPYSWPMWYLASQFVVYLLWMVLAWVAKKLGKSLPYNLLALVAVALLVFHMYHVEWQVLTGGTAWDSKLVRNAWLDGFPFFALGAFMARHRARIQSLPVKPLWVGAALCVGLALVEFSQVEVVDVLLGTTLLALILMAIALASPGVESPLLRRTACFCGRELTFFIYVLHVPIYGVILEWRDQVEAFVWLYQHRVTLFPLVSVLSTLAALGIYGLSQWRRGLKAKRS